MCGIGKSGPSSFFALGLLLTFEVRKYALLLSESVGILLMCKGAGEWEGRRGEGPRRRPCEAMRYEQVMGSSGAERGRGTTQKHITLTSHQPHATASTKESDVQM